MTGSSWAGYTPGVKGAGVNAPRVAGAYRLPQVATDSQAWGYRWGRPSES